MNPGRPFLDVNTLSMAFFALALVFFHDSFSEYGVRIKLLNSRHMAVKYVTVVLLICYVLAFGVLNGGSFIYFQF